MLPASLPLCFRHRPARAHSHPHKTDWVCHLPDHRPADPHPTPAVFSPPSLALSLLAFRVCPRTEPGFVPARKLPWAFSPLHTFSPTPAPPHKHSSTGACTKRLSVASSLFVFLRSSLQCPLGFVSECVRVPTCVCLLSWFSLCLLTCSPGSYDCVSMCVCL